MQSIKQIETKIDHAVSTLLEGHSGETGCVLLDDNLDAFGVRAISAKESGRSLDLQYYIWKNDLTGLLLGYELLRAADRGVRIRLLLDDMNAHDKDTLLATLELHDNIEIRLFNPSYARCNWLSRSFELVFRGLSLNRRMHNKAWIVDERVAIVGGRNIGDEYFNASQKANFFDIDALLTGDVVAEVSNIFDTFWNSPTTVPLSSLVKGETDALSKLRQYIKELDDGAIQQTNVYLEQIKKFPSTFALFNGDRKIYWAKEAHVYSDPPEKAFDSNKGQWLINRLHPIWMDTKTDLKLISPYFVPGKEGMELINKLRSNGMSVGVLTNSLAATDVMLVHSGYAHYRFPLLKGGVEIHELMPFSRVKKKLLGSSGASLHTKAFIVDYSISFIGSFNLDPRSVRLNTEMGILINQPDIAKELLALYDQKIGENNSYQLFIEQNGLRWIDRSENIKKIWKHEPEVGFFKRVLTKVIGWLPIESQL